MANKLDNVKLVPLSLLSGKYTTDLKAWVQAQAGESAAAALKTVSVDTTNSKLKFYKELSKDITGETVPSFSIDYAKVAGTGKAEDVSLTAIDGLTATQVQAAVAEIVEAIATINESIGTIGDLETEAEDLVSAINEVKGLADDAQTDATDALTKIGKATEGEVAGTGLIKDIEDINAVLDDLGTAANADVATTAIGTQDEAEDALPTVAQVKKYVTDEVASLEGATHFIGKVEKLEDVTDPQAGDIVLVGAKEYIYDKEGNWVEIGDETIYVTKATTIAGVDLQNDVTKEEMLTALNVEDGAQVNIVETVKVNGTALTPDDDKAVNVTVAEGETDGTIAVNGVDVAVHGLDTMAYEKAEDYVDFDSVVLAEDSDIVNLFKID